MCLKIHELDLVKKISVPGLVRHAALNNTKVKVDLLTDINIILMVEKEVIRGICHSIYRYSKANNKDMKDYDKNEESSYLQYWDVNNIFGWVMSQKLSLNNFK